MTASTGVASSTTEVSSSSKRKSPWDMLVTVHPMVSYCKGSNRVFRTARGCLPRPRRGQPLITACPCCREHLQWAEYVR